MGDLKHDCPILYNFARMEGRWPVTAPCPKCGKVWKWVPEEGQWVEVK
jgi:hypothetical protein